VVLATHNVETRIWERRAQVAANPLARWFYGLQARRMASFERAAVRRSDWVTAVSAPEREVFRGWGARAASLAENGAELEQFSPADRAAERAGEMLFLGALDWDANRQAVLHFVTEILPLVRQQRPAATLRVVGRRAPADFRARLAGVAGVEFVGEVADVRPELARASVVVVPLEVG